MRIVWNAVSVLMMLHVAGAAGFAGWLYADGRLNKERLDELVEMFSLTVEKEQAQEQQAKELAQQAEQRAIELAHMESVADGPATVNELLADRQQRSDIADAKLDHLKRVVEDLQRRVRLEREALQQQVAELEAEREQFEAFKEQELAKINDVKFQRAVSTLEQLKPKQGKEMFKQMLASGKEEEVVDYLEHMQLRKAAAILKEFKAQDEIAMATTLLEDLRQRGVELY